MTVKVVALLGLNEDEPEALAKYFGLMQPVMDRVGAKIISRDRLGDSVVGEMSVDLIVIVEYPDQSSVNEVFNGPEYETAREYRNKAFSAYSIQLMH